MYFTIGILDETRFRHSIPECCSKACSHSSLRTGFRLKAGMTKKTFSVKSKLTSLAS